jgi:site-specific recombinase XerD
MTKGHSKQGAIQMKNTALTTRQAAPLSAVATIEDVLALLDDWHTALDRSVLAGDITTATCSTYRVGVDRFITWANIRANLSVDFRQIDDWRAAMRTDGRSKGTINTWLAGLRSFYSWAVGAGRMAYDPTAGVKREKRSGANQHHKRQPLTDREVRRVLAQPDTDTIAGKRDYALLCLFVFNGPRTIEVHRANVDDLQTKAGRMVLYVQGKGHADADDFTVITNPDLEAALHDWLAVRGNDAGPLFTSLSNRSARGRLSLKAIRTIVKNYFRAAGVVQQDRAPKTTHSLRHTAISNAIRHGAPIQKVQSMARHQSIDTTMIYFHEADRLENPAEAAISYDDAGEE